MAIVQTMKPGNGWVLTDTLSNTTVYVHVSCHLCDAIFALTITHGRLLPNDKLRPCIVGSKSACLFQVKERTLPVCLLVNYRVAIDHHRPAPHYNKQRPLSTLSFVSQTISTLRFNRYHHETTFISAKGLHWQQTIRHKTRTAPGPSHRHKPSLGATSVDTRSRPKITGHSPESPLASDPWYVELSSNTDIY